MLRCYEANSITRVYVCIIIQLAMCPRVHDCTPPNMQMQASHLSFLGHVHAGCRSP